MDNINRLLAEKLKLLRKEKNVSQGLLAKELGVTATSVLIYEKGFRIPDALYIANFTKYFDVSTDYLLSINKNNAEMMDDLNVGADAISFLHKLLSISSFPIKQKNFMYDLLACVAALGSYSPLNEETY